MEILPGQYFDAETGLHQNWHRDYDPSIGRYLQSDPLGLKDGPSTYAYAANNPARWTDPTGLVKWTGSISIGKFSYGPKIGKIRIPLFGYADVTLDVTSECVDGKRVVAMIEGYDLDSQDWRHVGFFAFSGDVKLEDNYAYPSIASLEGAFELDSFSLVRGTGIVSSGSAMGNFDGGGIAAGRVRLTGKARRVPYTSYEEACQCEGQ